MSGCRVGRAGEVKIGNKCAGLRLDGQGDGLGCANLSGQPLAEPGSADVDAWEAGGEEICLLHGVVF